MRYLVTIGVPDGDVPLVSQSVEIMARCLADLDYERALPELASLGKQAHASPDLLKRTLSRWARTVKPEDMAIVYFNGHGDGSSGRHYLGLPDTDWQYPSTYALPTEDLLRVLTEGTELRNLLLILDTCYSGQAAFDAQAIAGQLVNLYLDRIIVLITASLPNWKAADGDFAKAFDKRIEALRKSSLLECYRVDKIVSDLGLPDFQRATHALIGASSAQIPDFLRNPNFISGALQGHPVEERSLYRRDLVSHWKPRAMGSEATFQSGNWYFTGRTHALQKIINWLDQPAFDGTACVVTGNPGSGKSAVLGYLVTASDPEELKSPSLQKFLASMPVRPEPAVVSFALHLKGKTLLDALSALASHFNSKSDDVLADLAARTEKTVLVFDALDESPEASKSAVFCFGR